MDPQIKCSGCGLVLQKSISALNHETDRWSTPGAMSAFLCKSCEHIYCWDCLNKYIKKNNKELSPVDGFKPFLYPCPNCGQKGYGILTTPVFRYQLREAGFPV